MEIAEKEWNELRGKVAALEKEQLTIKKYIEEKLNDDEELVESVKEFRNEIKELLETFNTNATKSIAGKKSIGKMKKKSNSKRDGKMENIDKTIDGLCDLVQRETKEAKHIDECRGLPELVKALAELVSARAQLN